MKSRIKSFVFAFEGLKYTLYNEPNFLIHLVLAVVTVVFGFLFKINALEWIAVTIAIIMVLVTEMINTSIERICDKIEPNKDHQIKIIKDIAAAAVLMSAIASVVIGLIIFLPKIMVHFKEIKLI